MNRMNLLAMAIMLGLAQGAGAEEANAPQPGEPPATHAGGHDATTLDAVTVDAKFIA